MSDWDEIHRALETERERQRKAIMEYHPAPAIEIARLNRLLAAALALTNTGSEEFRKAFPAFFNNGYCDGMEVPGWRVVEKIREVLLQSAPKSG